MSCPAEATWAVYADGELDAEQVRDADAHLVACETCRSRVLALREEAAILARAFQDREALPWLVSVAPPAEPRPALSRPGVLLGAALLLGVVGTLVEIRLATGGPLLGGLDPRTLVPRLFGTLVLLRDRAPGLFELALAVAATAGASGLATFAVSGALRRWTGSALLGVLLALPGAGVATEAGALERRRDEAARVGADERVEGSLIASGEWVDVDGVVAGDLYAGAHRVRVRGVVLGNLFAFADELELEGRVEGDVVAVVERSQLRGEVTGSVYAATERLDVAPAARIGRDLFLFAEEVALEGRAGRDVNGLVDRFELGGAVARSMELKARRLELLPSARVEGDLTAFLPRGEAIQGVTEGRVGGALRVEPHGRGPGLARYLKARFWVWLVVRITAAFLVGMVLYLLAPGLFRFRATPPLRTFGLGLGVLLGAPVLLALLGFSLVGLPLAVFGLFAYLAALYAAGVVVAGQLGLALLEPESGERRAFGLALLVGLLVLATGASLPFFGPVVRGVVVLAGLGLLAERAREALGPARAGR